MIHTSEHLNKNKLRLLSVVSFVLSITTALLTYLESRYLEQLIGEQWAGLGFFVGYGITVVVLDNLARIVNKMGKLNTALMFTSLTVVSLGALAVLPPVPWLALPAFILYIVSLSLLWIVIDFFIEVYSSDAVTGEVRGRYLTIMNAGWVITPLFASVLFETYGFPLLFSLAALLTVPVFLVFRYAFQHVPDHLRHPARFFTTLQTILQHQSLSYIFIIAFVHQFFYAWMIFYMPLHLSSLGFTLREIGQIFTIMLLPFVLLQYPAGILADRKWGEKELLITGLAIMGISTMAVYFVESRNFLVWAGILFATRVGASLIEIMRDTYFFKQIDYRDLQLMSFFRNTQPLAYMMGPLIATPLLFYVDRSMLFLILGIFVLSSIFFAARLKDTK